MSRQPTPHHETPHRDIRSGGMRAAVFGVSDGLVSNIALVLGIAGAHASGGVVRLSGLAGLMAGAFSMAAGEYLSMQAQREMWERELAVERDALARSPAAEHRELVAIYERRGLEPALAEEMASALMREPELALETHAREEMGLDLHSLGTPLVAAVSSFVMFALGSLVPLVPWLITSGLAATVASVVAGALAAIAIGVCLGILTGRSRGKAAVRQLVVTVMAAGITYGLGRLVGISISGA